MTTQTIDIPHLGGSTIGYRFGRDYDPSLPTLVMSNSFTTSVGGTARSSPTRRSVPG